jgi:hypothetical protein
MDTHSPTPLYGGENKNHTEIELNSLILDGLVLFFLLRSLLLPFSSSLFLFLFTPFSSFFFLSSLPFPFFSLLFCFSSFSLPHSLLSSFFLSSFSFSPYLSSSIFTAFSSFFPPFSFLFSLCLFLSRLSSLRPPPPPRTSFSFVPLFFLRHFTYFFPILLLVIQNTDAGSLL